MVVVVEDVVNALGEEVVPHVTGVACCTRETLASA